MEVFTLLENLEEILESGSKVPFSTKVMVDAGELRDIIEEIRLKLPDELKQAKWVKEERQRIISDAELEAQKVLKETEGKIINLIDEHEITKQALAQKEEIIENANNKTNVNTLVNNTSKNNVNNTPVSHYVNSSTNTATGSDIPYTGVEDTIMYIIGAIIVIAIVFYIKFELVNKEIK